MDDLKTESEAATGCEASAAERIVMFGNSVAIINKAQDEIRGWHNADRETKSKMILDWGIINNMETSLSAEKLNAAAGKFSYLRQEIADFLDFICAYDAVIKT